LRKWREVWGNYALFAHGIYKMFGFLNSFFLQNQKKVAEEAFDAFK